MSGYNSRVRVLMKDFLYFKILFYFLYCIFSIIIYAPHPLFHLHPSLPLHPHTAVRVHEGFLLFQCWEVMDYSLYWIF